MREVRAAFERLRREETTAKRAIAVALRSGLNDTLTALLLHCELALEAPGLPAAAAEQLQSAFTLVKKIRTHLEKL